MSWSVSIKFSFDILNTGEKFLSKLYEFIKIHKFSETIGGIDGTLLRLYSTIVPLPRSRSCSPATERVSLSSNMQFHTFIAILIYIRHSYEHSYSQMFTIHSLKNYFWDKEYQTILLDVKSGFQSPWRHIPVDESIVSDGTGVDASGGRINNGGRKKNFGRRIGAVAGPRRRQGRNRRQRQRTVDGGAEQNINKLRNEVAKGQWWWV